MKTIKILSFLSLSAIIILASCKKDKSTGDDEIQTTYQLSQDQAAGESIGDDVNSLFLEASVNAGLATGRLSDIAETNNSLSCASVTVTQGNFPKTMVIDFGAGCTSIDGVLRAGKINIVISDSVHHNGATAVMTFTNYFVENYKVEGTITWVNTSTPNGISWTRDIADGKITAPGANYYWLHVGSKTVQQTGGASTPYNLLDDVYTITGNHTVTNPLGKSRTATITEALEKQVICHNVSKGKVKVEGPNHYAIVDYGNGTCDNVATVSIDGNNPRTIILP